MIDVNIEDFKNLLNLAGAFTDEATFNIKEGTLDVLVIDGAHVAMAKGSIKLNNTPEVDSFTVEVEKALKALATTGSDVKMYAQGGTLLFKGDKSKASISLIGSSSGNTLREPNFETTAFATIQPARLKPVLNFGQYAKTDYIKFSIEDGKMSIITGVFPNVAEVDGDENGEGTAMAGFMMDYIQTINDLATKAKSNLKILLMGDDRPARFEWGTDDAKYSALVAPRIES